MQTARPFAAFAMAFALALSASGIVAAQTHAHDGSGEAPIEIMLNNGAKWQGDQNMITGMTAIHGTMAANLEAIHAGTLPADASKEIAADIQKQLDFMIENCVLEPKVDEQFHVILGEVMTGVSALEAGETETGAVTIVQALNAYGEHFEHPGWQAFN
jgi:hypothetical protein